MEFERYKMIYKRKYKSPHTTKTDFILGIDESNDKEKSYNIRILGNEFVKNNKNKGKLIINNKKYNLKESINSKEIKDSIVKINMILIKELSNFSHLFENCKELEEFFFRIIQYLQMM